MLPLRSTSTRTGLPGLFHHCEVAFTQNPLSATVVPAACRTCAQEQIARLQPCPSSSRAACRRRHAHPCVDQQDAYRPLPFRRRHARLSDMQFRQAPAPLDGQRYVRAEPELDGSQQVGRVIDRPAICDAHEVARHDASSLRRRVRLDLPHDDISYQHRLRDHERQREQENRQDGVHPRPCKQDGEPLPCALACETARVGWILLAEHAHEAAERQQVERIVRVAAPESKHLRREADAELQHPYPHQFRHGEVAELVHDDEHAKDGEEDEDGHVRPATRNLPSPPSDGAPMRRPRTRPRASTRRTAHAYRVRPARCGGCLRRRCVRRGRGARPPRQPR